MPPAPDDYTGVFSRLGGYDMPSTAFGNGFVSSVDVYFDLSDPAVAASTYGWDVSTAVNNQSGGHLRDFIFHAAGEPGKIVIAADNGTSFARRGDLSSLANHFDVTISGWYTLEWNFRNNGGVLAVDCKLYDNGGTLLFTETRSGPTDLIASVVGGNRYMWFTFVAADKLAIDNTSLTRKPLYTTVPPSGTAFNVGTTAVAFAVTDACGHTGSCGFDVTVNDTQNPTIVCAAPALSYAADAGACNYTVPATALDPISTGDNCTIASVVNDFNSSNTLQGANFPLGSTIVTWTIEDGSGNTASCSYTVVVVDSEIPAITCPANAVVTQHDEKDPFATGYATATDNCAGSVTITYTDNRDALNLCNATGVISRTWKATDAAGNIATCVQTITVQDIDDPLAICPSDITTSNDPGNCSAVVNFATNATDFGFYQGFENPLWISGIYGITPSVDWNRYSSEITRVNSGTDGITSKLECAHAVINSTTLPPAPDDYTGVFSRLGGYDIPSTAFGNGFVSSVDVYFDLSDPAVSASTYGWDVSTAVSNQSGGHLRDFIFHAAGEPGKIVIAADNNTNYARRGDLSSLANHFDVTTSGWYTLEWNFRNNGGVLAVDCKLYDNGGSLLFTETRSAPTDLIASVVGGNRYMWFTFVAADKLAIDNTSLTRKPLYTTVPPSGAAFAVGTTAVTITAIDACGHTGSCGFNVTVNDTQNPTIACATPATNYAADAGVCTYTVPGTALDPTSTGDNCSILSVVNDKTGTSTLQGAVFSLGTTNVIWTNTDGSGNTATCSYDVVVVDSQNPTITCATPATNYAADAGICTYLVTGTALDPLSTGDNCSILSVVNDKTGTSTLQGAVFSLGTTNVVWTITDGSGNTATCSYNVVVVATQNPTITCTTPATNYSADAGICTYLVTGTALDPLSTGDNCSILSVVNDKTGTSTLQEQCLA
ncbi:MAG: HYR domain-containing protein [Bacteroidales bacterium]|nr:HYR domain-containing protein [Bacteroidales bacterium]